jgi:hypothetical protein
MKRIEAVAVSGTTQVKLLRLSPGLCPIEMAV